MNTMSASTSKESIILAEESITCQGLQLTYRLLLHEPHRARIYCISVFSDEEECTEAVGGDLLRATAFYRTVCEGFVTPCTLSDVLCDLRLGESG